MAVEPGTALRSDIAVNVAMVDPSLFTLPYDMALCSAVRAHGRSVTLYGRPLRALEIAPPQDAPDAFFHGLSERMRGHCPNKLFHAVKGLEHSADMLRLLARLRRHRPSIVHFQWLPLPAIDRAIVRRIRRTIAPVVLTVHDTVPFNNSPTSILQRLGSHSAWADFDKLIVHGESSKDHLAARGINASRISVIAHGVLKFTPVKEHAMPAGDRLVILLFGRIKTYKGVDVIIEALGRLPAEHRNRYQLLVVGEPLIPIEPFKERAAALGIADNITWDLRYVSDADMAGVFSRADIFAFPYREIDTSGVLMACLQYGKPIIASGIGAFRTLLQDGVHGSVVPPDDPDALAEALRGMAADHSMRATYGRNVAFLGTRIPSWDEIAGQTVALYDALVRERIAPAPKQSFAAWPTEQPHARGSDLRLPCEWHHRDRRRR
jgi:glycosyltransferase involved in cell wall biosynthesis